MVDSVSSSSSTAATLLQQKITDFENGKVNITKTDLDDYVSEYKANGEDIPDNVQTIIDSYDKIDKDGDGVSNTELSTYNMKTTALASYADFNSSVSLLQYMNSSDSDTTDSLTSLVSSNISNSTSSYMNKLLEQYSSTASTDSTSDSTATSGTSSLLDYIT